MSTGRPTTVSGPGGDERADLRRLLDAAVAAIYAYGPEDRWTYVNAATERALGMSRGELVGRRPDEVLPPEVAASFLANNDEVRATGEAVRVEETVTNGDVVRVFATEKFPLSTVGGVGGVSIDITDRVNQRAELRRRTEEAERASGAKSEFLSRMSHELRTPLNAILGFAQLLELDVEDPEQRDSIKQILRSGSHLLDLVNEILDLARIESGRMSYSIEPVEVTGVVAEAIELVGPLAADREVEMRGRSSGEVHALVDRQRLRQILINLLAIRDQVQPSGRSRPGDRRPGG